LDETEEEEGEEDGVLDVRGRQEGHTEHEEKASRGGGHHPGQERRRFGHGRRAGEEEGHDTDDERLLDAVRQLGIVVDVLVGHNTEEADEGHDDRRDGGG